MAEELDTDSEYIFRVAAINKYGTGEFVEFPIVHTSAAQEELVKKQEKLYEVRENIDEEEHEKLMLIEEEEVPEETGLEKGKTKEMEELERKSAEQHEILEVELKPAEELVKPKTKETVRRQKPTEENLKEVERPREIIVLEEAAIATETTFAQLDLEKLELSATEVVRLEEKPEVKDVKKSKALKEKKRPGKKKDKAEAAEHREESVQPEEKPSMEAFPHLAKEGETTMDKKVLKEAEKEHAKEGTEGFQFKPKKEKVEEGLMETVEVIKISEKPAEIPPVVGTELVEVQKELKPKKKVKKSVKEEKPADQMTQVEEKGPTEKVVEKVLEVELGKKPGEEKKPIAESVAELPEEKKPTIKATDLEVSREFQLKEQKKDEGEICEAEKIVKKSQKASPGEEMPKLKKKKIVKRKPSQERKQEKVSSVAEKPVEVTDTFEPPVEKFDIQQQVVEEIMTSESLKLEAESWETEKSLFAQEALKEEKPIVEKVRKGRKETASVAEVKFDVFLSKVMSAEEVDEILLVESKDATSADAKEVSKKKKSKVSGKLSLEKEEFEATKKDGAKAKEEKAKIKKALDETAEAKKLIDKAEEKPEKKVTTKKIPKKGAKKELEEEIQKRVEVKPKDIEATETMELGAVAEFEIKEARKAVEDNIYVDKTIHLPTVSAEEKPEFEEATELEAVDGSSTVSSIISSDEGAPRMRPVRQRRSGFLLPPDREILAFRGDIVKIECELFNEDDKIAWIINGRTATNDSRCTEIVDGYIRILKIEKIVPEDTNTIVIANVNEHYAESRLVVDDLPAEIIEKLPRKSKGKMGDVVKLSVATSHTTQNFQWFFNNEPILEGNSRFEAVVESNTLSLLIKNVTYEQTGRYSVKVDSAETSTLLTIEGPPMIQETELTSTTAELESEENLVLTVPFKAVPEPILECFFNGEQVSRSLKVQLDILNDTVRFCKRKVNRNDAGKYTIKIRNDYGEVSQTFIVNVRGLFFQAILCVKICSAIY